MQKLWGDEVSRRVGLYRPGGAVLFEAGVWRAAGQGAVGQSVETDGEAAGCNSSGDAGSRELADRAGGDTTVRKLLICADETAFSRRCDQPAVSGLSRGFL